MKHKKERRFSQHNRWVIAAIASLVMHGSVLLFVSQSIEKPGKTATAARPANHSMVVRVMTEPSNAAQAEPTESIPPEKLAATIKPAPAEGLVAPGQELSSTSPRKPGMSDVRFFDIEEVDQPALPMLDWNFPDKTATSLKLRRLVIEIWIAEDGRLLDMNIISSRPEISRSQQAEIIEALMQTKMTPATRQGNIVASRRVLEMGFASE